ncbi:hypothetical protein [Amycolatopsis jiangsuensis]|uniref:PE domain-containing protein n=1 Tax=Amycolatopsis jiangsuensis TaxID=1181879 RepID=A0A840J0F6_9PSEU|nr:hypothetical protein [Amycolatopsis jiangsuensis]MBB4686997.1 hypothetical protein [Amycolatopsis jiangsuensis]
MSTVPGTDALAAGGLDAKGVAEAATQTRKLVDSAKSGGFTIDGDALGDLRKALTDMVTRLEGLRPKTQVLASPPQLGSHPYGHIVAEHDRKSGADTAGSATDVLDQFGRLLREADEALARAAGVYTENEDQAIDTHRTVKGAE